MFSSPPRRGALVQGEGWSRPSERELAQARVCGLLMQGARASESVCLSEIGMGA
ncbi:hypothetical protein DEO72_LG4g662 [Vigna unguiculata]|uniref:Uncharacterized protein n=1 Tax=Vigna unguiculata TaxID=3917 RepID=A0A4D6LNC1_VIGUN|nr:hypothetical protein DEO72_LG4g662 [Vigna unguiculata]